MRRATAAHLLALALCACSTPLYREPTTEELAAADYGTTPVDYEERLKAFLLMRYQDRAVAAAQIGTPRRS